MAICRPEDTFDPQGNAASFGRGEPGPVTAAGLPHTPTQLSISSCKAITRSIRLQHGQAVRVQLQPTDHNGGVVSLTPAAEGEQDGSSSSVADDLVYAFLIKRSVSDRTPVLARYDGTVVDSAKSLIEFSLASGAIPDPGIYEGALVIFNADRTAMYWSTPYWVEVRPSLHSAAPCGPPTISELRLRLRDACPEANELLDDYEFTDEEIIQAIRDPIDKFNVTRPPITSYTPASFPRKYRYYWVQAAIGQLLRMVAVQKLRNQLKVDGGGISEDHNDKYKEYIGLAQSYLNDWDNWTYETKARLNAGGWMGSVGSSYGR